MSHTPHFTQTIQHQSESQRRSRGRGRHAASETGTAWHDLPEGSKLSIYELSGVLMLPSVCRGAALACFHTLCQGSDCLNAHLTEPKPRERIKAVCTEAEREGGLKHNVLKSPSSCSMRNQGQFLSRHQLAMKHQYNCWPTRGKSGSPTAEGTQQSQQQQAESCVLRRRDASLDFLWNILF